MCSDNLTRNANQSANLCGCQLSDFVACGNLGKRNVTFLFNLCAILNKVTNGLAEEREDSEELKVVNNIIHR